MNVPEGVNGKWRKREKQSKTSSFWSSKILKMVVGEVPLHCIVFPLCHLLSHIKGTQLYLRHEALHIS